MARYIQRIALLGNERWIGWGIDVVGTEVPGLILADELSEAELRARGVKEFQPLDFETFLGMNPEAGRAGALLDQDIDFRLERLMGGMGRILSRAGTAGPARCSTRTSTSASTRSWSAWSASAAAAGPPCRAASSRIYSATSTSTTRACRRRCWG